MFTDPVQDQTENTVIRSIKNNKEHSDSLFCVISYYCSWHQTQPVWLVLLIKLSIQLQLVCIPCLSEWQIKYCAVLQEDVLIKSAGGEEECCGWDVIRKWTLLKAAKLLGRTLGQMFGNARCELKRPWELNAFIITLD